MTALEEAARARRTTQPDIRDRDGKVWCWRGHGYALESQPDTDWKGRPWTVQADTVVGKFGRWKGKN